MVTCYIPSRKPDRMFSPDKNLLYMLYKEIEKEAETIF